MKYDNKRYAKLILSFVLFTTITAPSFAKEVIEFPEEELAKESVLPVFDRKQTVLARNVVTEGKFEVGVYGGFLTTEPIYNQSKFGVNLGYHRDEHSAIVVNFAKWSAGLNTLYSGGLSDQGLDFERVPKKNYTLFGHYEWKVYYGKISLTKQGVLNLHLYPIVGLGINSYEHKNYYGADFGIGQKFYFGKNFALRTDFKLQYMQEVDPFLGDTNGGNCDSDPSVARCSAVPSPGDFRTKMAFGTVIDIGLSFLF